MSVKMKAIMKVESEKVKGHVQYLNVSGGIDEQRVRQIVVEETSDLQPKVDDSLETENKTIVGAINELNAKEDKVGVSREEVEQIVDEKTANFQTDAQVNETVSNAISELEQGVILTHTQQLANQSQQLFDIDMSIQTLQGNLGNYALLNGGNTFTGTQYFEQIVVNGSIIQLGEAYEIHGQHVYTINDYIVLRDGAISGLGANEYAGFIAKLYDGEHDGKLVFDGTGTARVGDVGNEQPLATRDEAANFVDGHLIKWDSVNQRLVDAGPEKKLYAHNVEIYIYRELTETFGKSTVFGHLGFTIINSDPLRYTTIAKTTNSDGTIAHRLLDAISNERVISSDGKILFDYYASVNGVIHGGRAIQYFTNNVFKGHTDAWNFVGDHLFADIYALWMIPANDVAYVDNAQATIVPNIDVTYVDPYGLTQTIYGSEQRIALLTDVEYAAPDRTVDIHTAYVQDFVTELK